MEAFLIISLCVLALVGICIYGVYKEKKENEKGKTDNITPDGEDSIYAFHVAQADASQNDSKKDLRRDVFQENEKVPFSDRHIVDPNTVEKQEKSFESSVTSKIIKAHACIGLTIGILYGIFIFQKEIVTSLLIMYGSLVFCALLMGFSEIIDNTKAIRENTDRKE